MATKEEIAAAKAAKEAAAQAEASAKAAAAQKAADAAKKEAEKVAAAAAKEKEKLAAKAAKDAEKAKIAAEREAAKATKTAEREAAKAVKAAERAANKGQPRAPKPWEDLEPGAQQKMPRDGSVADKTLKLMRENKGATMEEVQAAIGEKHTARRLINWMNRDLGFGFHQTKTTGKIQYLAPNVKVVPPKAAATTAAA